MATQEKPKMTDAELAAYRCLHCRRNLVSNQKGKHCASPNCRWIMCSCGASNDVLNKRATHKSHGPACHSQNRPCERI